MNPLRIKLCSWPYLMVVLLVVLMPLARAEKVWTNMLSGLWQNGTNWTGHTSPDITSFIEITNDSSKTITINAQTPATELTAQMLTLSAPPGATNTLLVTDAGTNNPLTLQTGLELLDGAAMRITNSALLLQLTNYHVNIDGSMTLDSGLIDFGDLTVTARVGRATSGVLTINSGSVSSGTMIVGGLTNSTGTLQLNGGLLLVSSLMSIGRNLTTTGTAVLGGGQLSVPNDDTRVGDEGAGSMTISNATATLTNLQVGRDLESVGALTLQTGGIVQVQSDVEIGRFTGSTGTVTVSGGQLQATSVVYVGRGGGGQLSVSNGLISCTRLLVAADTTNSIGGAGLLEVGGGTLSISSNFLVGSESYSTGRVVMTGGTLLASNAQGTAVSGVSSGGLALSGGVLLADNLVLTNATGQMSFGGGTLITKRTQVANGSPFVVGDGTSVAILRMDGGTHSFANGLIISSNATLEGCGTVLGTIINHGTISTNCGGTPVAPGIVNGPVGQSVAQGGTLNLSVTASGTQPLSYQWQLDGVSLAGATASSYSKLNMQSADAGNYSVIITNSVGSVTSSVATVTILLLPQIVNQPVSQIITQGAGFSLLVTASGAQPLSYQWQMGGVNLAGATASSFTKTNAHPSDAGNYTVVVTNPSGSVTSSVATVTVLIPPSITTAPSNSSAVVGGTATFSIVAAGTQPLTYQWQHSGTNLPGATASSFTIANVQLTDAGQYKVTVTNSAGSITSPSAMLQVANGLLLVFVSRTGSTNTFSVQSTTGATYNLEFKDSLVQTNWTRLSPSIGGTGGLLLLQDPSAAGSARFYRLQSL